MRVRCQKCGEMLASPRGGDRLRFVPTMRVLAVRVSPDGTNTVEGVCPKCRADVSIPLPLEARSLRGPTVDDLREAADAAR